MLLSNLDLNLRWQQLVFDYALRNSVAGHGHLLLRCVRKADIQHRPASEQAGQLKYARQQQNTTPPAITIQSSAIPIQSSAIPIQSSANPSSYPVPLT